MSAHFFTEHTSIARQTRGGGRVKKRPSWSVDTQRNPVAFVPKKRSRAQSFKSRRSAQLHFARSPHQHDPGSELNHKH